MATSYHGQAPHTLPFNGYHVERSPAERVNGWLDSVRNVSFDTLAEETRASHRALFRRVSVTLPTTETSHSPTDERIRQFRAGRQDPSPLALYFQYGRYLLISSSRPGSQPAILQGIWNGDTNPPWDSKFTININTEMNYWPTDSTNLDETLDPLVRFIKELSVRW